MKWMYSHSECDNLEWSISRKCGREITRLLRGAVWSGESSRLIPMMIMILMIMITMMRMMMTLVMMLKKRKRVKDWNVDCRTPWTRQRFCLRVIARPSATGFDQSFTFPKTFFLLTLLFSSFLSQHKEYLYEIWNVNLDNSQNITGWQSCTRLRTSSTMLAEAWARWTNISLTSTITLSLDHPEYLYLQIIKNFII